MRASCMGPKVSDRLRVNRNSNALTCNTLVITKCFITDSALQIDLIQSLLLRILVASAIRSFDVCLALFESAIALCL